MKPPSTAAAGRSSVRSLLALIALAVASCATLRQDTELNKLYGPANPARFDVPVAPAPGQPRWADVKPILDNRCVVCHACYDAPCQVKFTAWEGVARGASTAVVYDSGRLDEAPLTRLFVDAHLPSQWRQKGFTAILNERPAPEGNLAASVIFRSLALKQKHPLPAEPLLPKAVTLGLDRSQRCPAVEAYAGFEKDNPLWGMPYGLPGLNAREMDVITRWLAAGAPFEGVAPLPAAAVRQVQAWEIFLNGNSLKERLMSRYLYEHLYLGQLIFEDDVARMGFRLVRSTTPPGKPVAQVATRRPYDDPGVARVYYRLVPELETPVGKTYMPYVLGAARMDKYRAWFLTPDFNVAAMPSYALKMASNPFITFRDLPQESRYRFLLDEAQFFIMNFIKGSVCRGQIAVNVIEDRFWVVFTDPRFDANSAYAELVVRETGDLTLPAAYGSDAGIITPWLHFADEEKKYLREKSRVLEQAFAKPGALNLSTIWDGDGRNPNAALTIIRNFDNATVVKGFVGTPPKTSWVIGYPLFERLYYLLVAGYDVYGNAGHQLNSRLYMDFMRMEGEYNFLLFLPEAVRKPTADYWYRDARDVVKEYIYGRNATFDRQTGIDYRTKDPQLELYGLLKARLAPVLDKRYDLATVPDEALRRDLEILTAVRGRSLKWLPEMTVMRVDDPVGPPRWFTLLRDTAHANVSHLFREASELRPDEDTLTLVPGFIGDYPNAFYRLQRAELPAFTAAVRGLKSEADYRALATRFAVRRTNPAFWAHSDAVRDAYRQWAPDEAALFDLNRFENR
ncbi:MAG: fatty acid cis/trans isomerase [Burkholderiales bacterium]